MALLNQNSQSEANFCFMFIWKSLYSPSPSHLYRLEFVFKGENMIWSRIRYPYHSGWKKLLYFFFCERIILYKEASSDIICILMYAPDYVLPLKSRLQDSIAHLQSTHKAWQISVAGGDIVVMKATSLLWSFNICRWLRNMWNCFVDCTFVQKTQDSLHRSFPVF